MPCRQRIRTTDSKVPIILVVEDEIDNLLLISHTLIYLQLTFVTATKSKTAFELATKYEIDLILLDLVLPDSNGFDLANSLRHNELTKDLPIIAISALVQDKDRELALEFGCNDYLSKPYMIDDLKRKISKYIDIQPKPNPS